MVGCLAPMPLHLHSLSPSSLPTHPLHSASTSSTTNPSSAVSCRLPAILLHLETFLTLAPPLSHPFRLPLLPSRFSSFLSPPKQLHYLSTYFSPNTSSLSFLSPPTQSPSLPLHSPLTLHSLPSLALLIPTALLLLRLTLLVNVSSVLPSPPPPPHPSSK